MLKATHWLLLEAAGRLLLETTHGLLLLESAHRLLLETTHRLLLIATHGLRVVWADAPCVQAVEENYAALGIGPFPALEVKVDHDILAYLVLVYNIGARVGQLEEHVLRVLAVLT